MYTIRSHSPTLDKPTSVAVSRAPLAHVAHARVTDKHVVPS